MVRYKNPRTHLPLLATTYEEYSGSHLLFRITLKSNDTSSEPLEHMPSPKTSYEEVLGKMSRWIKSSHLGFRITPKSNKTSRGLRNPLGTFLPSLQTSHVVVMEKPKIVIGFLITSKRHNTSPEPLEEWLCRGKSESWKCKKFATYSFWSEKTPPLNFKTPTRICQKWQ